MARRKPAPKPMKSRKSGVKNGKRISENNKVLSKFK